MKNFINILKKHGKLMMIKMGGISGNLDSPVDDEIVGSVV